MKLPPLPRRFAPLLALCVVSACGDDSTRNTGIIDTPADVPLAQRTIAFQNGGDIWLMKGDGTGLQNLTNHPAADSRPAWDPLGDFIFFVSERLEADGDLFRMLPDGRELVPLTGAGVQREPAPGLQGNVAFVQGDETMGATLVRVRGTDNSYFTLTLPEGVERNPAWSRQGDRVAYAQDFEGIYTIRSDATVRTRVTSGRDTEPAWSPDGTQIVFVSGPASAASIWTVGSAGGQPRQVTSTGGEWTDDAPDWAGDGRWILFTRRYVNDPQNAQGGIFIMRPDGTELRRILPGTATHATWRPLPWRVE